MNETKEWMTPQDKWQKKAGYKVKGFKLKEDLIQQFEVACSSVGVSQAAQIANLMQKFINEQAEQK